MRIKYRFLRFIFILFFVVFAGLCRETYSFNRADVVQRSTLSPWMGAGVLLQTPPDLYQIPLVAKFLEACAQGKIQKADLAGSGFLISNNGPLSGFVIEGDFGTMFVVRKRAHWDNLDEVKKLAALRIPGTVPTVFFDFDPGYYYELDLRSFGFVTLRQYGTNNAVAKSQLSKLHLYAQRLFSKLTASGYAQQHPHLANLLIGPSGQLALIDWKYLSKADWDPSCAEMIKRMDKYKNKLTFNGGDFSGINARGRDFSHEKLTRRAFTDGFDRLFKSCYFVGADLTSCLFVDTDLDGTHFSLSRLEGADFTKADLSETVFWGAWAPGCNWSDTDMLHAEMLWSNLSAGNFTRADASQVVFKGCVLSDSDFTDAHLDNADFESAQLANVRWDRANLTLARLNKAQGLDAAQLCKARLCQTVVDRKFFERNISFFEGMLVANGVSPDTVSLSSPAASMPDTVLRKYKIVSASDVFKVAA